MTTNQATDARRQLVSPALAGFATAQTAVAHPQDVDGSEGETRTRAALRKALADQGADAGKMVVVLAEHLISYDPGEYPAVSLIAFASAPLRSAS